MPKNEFSLLLEKKFLEWQIKQGRRTTLKEFSDHIGVSRAAISLWLNGDRVPDQTNLQKLADMLGYEVFDVLNIPRPNLYLQRINKLFDRLTPERQQKLAEDAVRYEAEALKNERSTKPSKERKTKPR